MSLYMGYQRPFIVLYNRHDVMANGDPPFAFKCMAEDDDHAREQCLNAEPDADIVFVEQNNDVEMDAMADHIVELEATAERAERILVALREPSKEVWGAALEAYNNAPFATHTPRLIRALLAAVTAAEKEVGHD